MHHGFTTTESDSKNSNNLITKVVIGEDIILLGFFFENKLMSYPPEVSKYNKKCDIWSCGGYPILDAEWYYPFRGLKRKVNS
jgi:hypothetical protein